MRRRGNRYQPGAGRLRGKRLARTSIRTIGAIRLAMRGASRLRKLRAQACQRRFACSQPGGEFFRWRRADALSYDMDRSRNIKSLDRLARTRFVPRSWKALEADGRDRLRRVYREPLLVLGLFGGAFLEFCILNILLLLVTLN